MRWSSNCLVPPPQLCSVPSDILCLRPLLRRPLSANQMTDLHQPIIYTFDGHYRGKTVFADSTFNSNGDVIFYLADGRSFTMALHQVNILDTLGLTVRSEDLETRLKTIERALQDQPQLQSTLARLKVPRQGFTDWRVSLLRFDGDAEQTDQARRQRAAAAELLNQIDNNLYNLSQRLEETANTPVSSEDLRADTVELDQAVHKLIHIISSASEPNRTPPPIPSTNRRRTPRRPRRRHSPTPRAPTEHKLICPTSKKSIIRRQHLQQRQIEEQRQDDVRYLLRRVSRRPQSAPAAGPKLRVEQHRGYG